MTSGTVSLFMSPVQPCRQLGLDQLRRTIVVGRHLVWRQSFQARPPTEPRRKNTSGVDQDT